MTPVNDNSKNPNGLAEIQSVPLYTGEGVGPSQRDVKRDLPTTLRLFLLPIVVIIVFLLFLFLGILPNLSDSFTGVDKISTLNDEYLSKVELLTNLKSSANVINITQNDLTVLGSLAGNNSNTTVVLFQQKIADLARSGNLEVIEQSTGERILDEDQVDRTKDPLGLIEIPSIFAMQGTLPNIKNFISKLGTIEDFVIIGQMDLSSGDRSLNVINNSDAIVWSLKITLIKYQFQATTADDKLTKAFLAVPLSSDPDPDVLNYVRKHE